MLVITKYRPVSPLDLPRLVREVGAVGALTAPIMGTALQSIYYNECGCEVVLITKINAFADIDAKEKDPTNNKIGLLLIKAGFVLSSVDYLREFPGELPVLSKAFETL